MTRIDPPIYLETPKGPGWAHFVINPGLEASLVWVVFTESGQIWCVPNERVRACTNWTAERPEPEKPK